MNPVCHIGWALCLLLACNNPSTEPAAPQSQLAGTRDGVGTPPAPVRVRPDSEGLLFQYRSSEGSMETAERLDDIPTTSRQEVLVVDLSRSPEDRGSAHWVHLVDLRNLESGGEYPVQVLERRVYEKRQSVRREARRSAAVIIYSTAWCPVCDKARAFLKEQGIGFVEKDVEKDAGAAAELAAKAAKSGVKPTGVPVFDIGGTILPGFDPKKILSLVKPG